MDIIWKKEMVKDIALVGGLVGVQFVYAGNSVVLSYLMSLGLSPYTLVMFIACATFLLLSPIAFYFERSKWPNKLTLKFTTQLVLIALAGVTLFQSFFFKGIELTSPAVATAMPNLAPGIIFLIAWVFRLEKVSISCTYSKVKIMGTLLCVLGALAMSLLHGTPVTEAQMQMQMPLPVPLSILPPKLLDTNVIALDKNKVLGCLYLVGAVLALSTNVVLQASTLKEFPAPMSLCAITSFIGVFLTLGLQLIGYHRIETHWPHVSYATLVGYSLLGGMISGVCVSFNGWAMKKKGPVLVSMFGPVGTVVSVLLSILTVGDTFNLGSLAGMLVMFTGLYFVLWAKGKENFPMFGSDCDAEKPLLN